MCESVLGFINDEGTSVYGFVMLYDTPNKPKFDTNWQYNGVRLHSNVADVKERNYGMLMF